MKPRLPGADCANCPLAKRQFNGPVPMEGEPNADIIFIGEAPGEIEAIKKQPFVGSSGQLLRGLVERYHGDKRVAYTNVVACRPPDNRDPTPLEIKCCSKRFQNDLLVHPKAKRVLLGAVATQAVLGSGYPLRDYNGTWINNNTFVTYHPAFILRNPTKAKVLKVAIQTAFRKPVPLHEPHVKFELVPCPPPVPQHSMVAIDIETTTKYKSFKKDRITAISINFDNKTYIIPQEWCYGEPIKEWLTNTINTFGVCIVGHNFKYDAKFLTYQLGMPYPRQLFDTMLVHHCLNEEGLGAVGAGGDSKDQKSIGHGLKLLAKKFFGINYHYDDDWNNPDWGKLYHYAAVDSWVTMRLARALENSLKLDHRAERLYWELYEPASRALCRMEMNGFGIDTEESYKIKADLTEDTNRLIAEMRTILKELGWYDWENFNPAKRTKVEIMYGHLALPVQRSHEGRVTLDKDALKHLYEITESEQIKQFIMLLTAWSNNQKMSGTYIGEEFKESIELVDTGKRKRVKKAKEPKGLLSDVIDGIFHPTYNLQATITGRISANRIHQVPRKSAIHPITKKSINVGKKIKNQFVPLKPDHCIVQADWSQMELRVAAWASGDEGMIGAYNSGLDLHTETARAIFGENYEKASKDTRKEMRTKAKNFNFGVLYGMTAETVAHDWWEQLTSEQREKFTFEAITEEAKVFYKRWFEVRPGIARYQKALIQGAFETGEILTVFGRRREVTFIPQDQRSLAELRNHLLNFPIQSMASDCTLHSLIRIDKALQALQWDVLPMATVHDSIVFSCPRAIVTPFIQLCERLMIETAVDFFGAKVKFQADFEVGPRWGALNEVAGIVKIHGKDQWYYHQHVHYRRNPNHDKWTENDELKFQSNRKRRINAYKTGRNRALAPVGRRFEVA